jgi:hypothetical protein
MHAGVTVLLMTKSDQQMLEELDATIMAVAAADEPYWAAVELHGLASHFMTELGVAYRLYWTWSALTDWYELRPEERSEAVAAMRRAAGEWLVIAADGEARDAYLDRWMFDVLGLNRNLGREF